jgi:hypothetical protein
MGSAMDQLSRHEQGTRSLVEDNACVSTVTSNIDRLHCGPALWPCSVASSDHSLRIPRPYNVNGQERARSVGAKVQWVEC